ncbi:MAG: hypothetical protein OZSIB_1664 [Candidatus Ozemobacter sibiricus]|jgi:hypothetical protein|uniref:Uncharacterized protein n=1 Tax=Candidatus Ozemobacter sibiricus TaxID=2268124 RepID=A0A367ZKA2_9BACT|nr:MAG: hypothetical protein OZSIB_1664 [Candidatus Ozemobacter sibiricus]
MRNIHRTKAVAVILAGMLTLGALAGSAQMITNNTPSNTGNVQQQGGGMTGWWGGLFWPFPFLPPLPLPFPFFGWGGWGGGAQTQGGAPITNNQNVIVGDNKNTGSYEEMMNMMKQILEQLKAQNKAAGSTTGAGSATGTSAATGAETGTTGTAILADPAGTSTGTANSDSALNE